MALVGAVAACLLIVVVLVDAFEALILPRRVQHGYRPARLFYRTSWTIWRFVAPRLPAGRWRNAFLAIFGPLSLFALFTLWASLLIVAFALLHWSLATSISFPPTAGEGFAAYVYFSGTTFFTLGYGDIVPRGPLSRLLSVAESGLGFGFLAVVIGYLPVLYQAFSRRETTISLLDARAGSPPTASELLRRLGEARSFASVGPLLAEWERWATELLESHISFPVLSFYRSQHDNQSWVATLTTILDTSALLIAGTDGPHNHQARLTFAMARHAAVDLGLVFQTPPLVPDPDRLPQPQLEALRTSLKNAGLSLCEAEGLSKALDELRVLYEPFVNALARQFLFTMPGFLPVKPPVDNWQTSAWMRRSPGIDVLPAGTGDDEHFG